MRIVKVLIAESVIRDVETNTVAVFNLFEELSAVSYPLLVPKVTIYISSEKEATDEDSVELQFRIRLNETQLFESRARINFGGKSRARTLIRINGLLITQPGTLSVKIYSIAEELLQETSVIYSIITQASTPGVVAPATNQ